MTEINAGMEPEKPSGQIRGIWAITIILAVAIIIAGVVWYLVYSDTTNITGVNTPKISTSASPSISPTTSPDDETADWQTYINNTYDFSFKYPSDWTKKGPTDVGDDTIVYIFSNNEYPPTAEPTKFYFFVNKVDSLPSVTKTQDTINGYKVYITKDEPSRSGAIKYYFTQDDKSYIGLAFTPYDESSPIEGQDKEYPIFQKVLSTFKFL